MFHPAFLAIVAIPVGATVQLAAVAGWRLTERRWPGPSLALRRVLAAASGVVALACLGFGIAVVAEFGDVGGVGVGGGVPSVLLFAWLLGGTTC